ncbi:hypothetical protein OR1_01620 [Geobacter sp. OR-1]|uniref:helix-turn-helix transcriptional regulator n=1 Tax=Geobacter sp. OR-1 TaxID=1266765 RepID=UPI000542F35F|nr:WYL domain-containing protein [Geobacter sp. OR-1]GAM09345.1 hypothetical protein OR1_01620 [Geobacter sp. OR-1]
MKKFVRHINILRCLKKYPELQSTTQIQTCLKNLGVPFGSLRTIQRDLDELSKEFSIYGDEKNPQGWSWAKDAAVLLPGMDLHTALTFRLMKEFMSPLIPTACLESAKLHFKEASAVLSKDRNGKQHRAWLDKVQLISRGQPLTPPTIDEQVLSVVYDALFNDLRFSATYRRRNGKVIEECVINPVGIVFVNKAVCLVCTLWDYDDIKQMPLHRFESVKLLTTPAREIEGFSLRDYVENQKEFHFPVSASDIKLVANFTAGAAYHLSETPLSTDQEIKKLSDSEVVVTATVADTAQLRWWLLGFGNQVEVVKPKKLRDEMIETVNGMIKRYKA